MTLPTGGYLLREQSEKGGSVYLKLAEWIKRHHLIDFSVCGSFYCHTLPYAEFIRYPEKFRRNTDETHIHLLHA